MPPPFPPTAAPALRRLDALTQPEALELVRTLTTYRAAANALDLSDECAQNLGLHALSRDGVPWPCLMVTVRPFAKRPCVVAVYWHPAGRWAAVTRVGSDRPPAANPPAEAPEVSSPLLRHPPALAASNPA